MSAPDAGGSVTARLAEPADRAAVESLRHEVFVVEQGVPAELERDGRDDAAVHAVAYADGALVATGRLLTDGSGGAAVVGRMAVRAAARGQGAGAAVLQVLEAAARAAAAPAVELHAQCSAQGFYDRAGYTTTSPVYLEAGIEHVTMRKPLPVVRPVGDDDSAALIALIGGCWAEYPGCVLDIDGEEPWLRAPATAYTRWAGRMWVAELDGLVVACAGCKPSPDEPGALELKSLYVARAARRRGLGAELTGLVEDEARRRGLDRVVLWSDTRFADAHRLYTRLGYSQLPGSRDLHDLSATTEYPFAKDLAG